MPEPLEQRNPYQGIPPRAWIVLRLVDLHGSTHELKLVVDTGNPFVFVVSSKILAQFSYGDGPNSNTNFGMLEGGWFQFAMPELGLSQKVLAFASDDVVAFTKANHPEFEGLAGLPLLRLTNYGGDTGEFWIRQISSNP